MLLRKDPDSGVFQNKNPAGPTLRFDRGSRDRRVTGRAELGGGWRGVLGYEFGHVHGYTDLLLEVERLLLMSSSNVSTHRRSGARAPPP